MLRVSLLDMIHLGRGIGVSLCCDRIVPYDIRGLLCRAVCVFSLALLEDGVGDVGFECVGFYFVVYRFEINESLAVVY